MKYTHIIWDFNGTLFNDMWAGILSVNQMLKERGLPEISGIDAYRKVFKFPIIEYYKDIGFDFDKEPYEVLAPIWVELYNSNSKDSSLQTGALESLERCKDLGVVQVLLSATERNMLIEQVKELGIYQYFDEIMGLGNIHAYSKKDLAVRWLERNPRAVPLFIGDTEHDADVAASIGADCFLVANGHQSRERLTELGYNVFDDLYKIFEFLQISK